MSPMSFDIVDMPSVGVRIPAAFKSMAELRQIHRDATNCGLDIRQHTSPTCSVDGDAARDRMPRPTHRRRDPTGLRQTPNTGKSACIRYDALKIPIREFSMVSERLDFPVRFI